MKNLIYIVIIAISLISCADNRKYKQDKTETVIKNTYTIEKIHSDYHIIEVDGIKFIANTNGGIIKIK